MPQAASTDNISPLLTVDTVNSLLAAATPYLDDPQADIPVSPSLLVALCQAVLPQLRKP
jgi:hypothetical protein